MNHPRSRPRPLDPPSLPPGRHPRWLDDRERALLRSILAGPGLSNAQVAAIFRARTGRRICRTTVLAARKRDPAAEPGCRHLSADHRRLLDFLIREAGAGFNSRDLAEAFAELSGRTIHVSRVRLVAKQLGIAPGPSGSPRGPRRPRVNPPAPKPEVTP